MVAVPISSDAMIATPRPFSARRLLPLGVLAAGAAAFFAVGGYRYVSFAALAEHREFLVETVARSGAVAALVFIAGYAAFVSISLPGAGLLTVAGGFLFGPWLGTGYTIVGATAGATIVFLAARTGLGGLAARAGPWARRVESGFRDNALSYLLVLRLLPIVPFWLVNLAAGAARLPLPVFVLGTFFGIIPVTFIFASLGNGLGALIAEGRSPDIALLSQPSVLLPLLGLAALALLPVFVKRWRPIPGETEA